MSGDIDILDLEEENQPPKKAKAIHVATMIPVCVIAGFLIWIPHRVVIALLEGIDSFFILTLVLICLYFSELLLFAYICTYVVPHINITQMILLGAVLGFVSIFSLILYLEPREWFRAAQDIFLSPFSLIYLALVCGGMGLASFFALRRRDRSRPS